MIFKKKVLLNCLTTKINIKQHYFSEIAR